MNKVKYKAVKLSMKGLGILTKDVSRDLDSTLNTEGKDGWKLVNSITPASGFGESEKPVLIFMREIEQIRHRKANKSLHPTALRGKGWQTFRFRDEIPAQAIPALHAVAMRAPRLNRPGTTP